MGFLEKFTNLFSSKQITSGNSLERKSIFNQILVSLQRIGFTHRNTAKALEFYRTHELVYSCINKIADVMNDAELVVEQQNAKGDWEKVAGHPLIALLAKPNSYETGSEINRLRVQSEYIAGIAYFEKIYSKANILIGLEPLLPTSVTPKLNQSKTEIEYYVIQNGNIKYNLKPEQILIRKRADLSDLLSGLAPLQVAMKSVNADLGLSDYIDAFFNSDGTPSGILKVLNKTLSETDVDAAQARWKSRFGRNGSNQKGVAVLDQNAEFQKIGSNLNELDADKIAWRFESRICTVFGVPPILVGAYLGIVHTTANATIKGALQDFVLNKISPELRAYREWLTWNLLPEFERIDQVKLGKIRVNYDLSQVGYLQEDLDKLHDRTRKDFALGLITQNEARAETKRLPAKDGDKFLYELRQPKQLEPTNTEPDETEKDKPKLLVAPPEKKTFDFDGLTLGREPKGVELVINLKKMVADQSSESNKVLKILTKFRKELISEAVAECSKFEATIYQLTLSPNSKVNNQLNKSFESAFVAGREQIIEDINRQQSGKNITAFEQKDLRENILKKIQEATNLTIAKLINEIQKRAIDIFILLRVLGVDADFFEQLQEKLENESIKWLEERAANSVNSMIQSGRDDEIENQHDLVKFVEYSAILDPNTCEFCADADGETAEDVQDLPSCPNPDCLGRDRCRCFHVAVII